MSEFKIIAIPANLITYMWPIVVPFLDLAINISDEEVNSETVYKDLLSGDAMCLLIADEDDTPVAAVTIAVTYFNSGLKVLSILLTGGRRMDRWIQVLTDKLQIIAKDLECKQIRGYCARKGWYNSIANTEDNPWTLVHETYKIEVK